MHVHRWPGLWIALFLIGTLMLPLAVQAQGAPVEIKVQYVQANEFSNTPNDLTLRVFFTAVDTGNKPVVNPQIQVASIVLDPEDGGSYSASVRKADGPIAIALVLDASRSMNNNISPMLTAAKQLVNDLGSQASFVIIRFNDKENIEILTSNFTNDKTQLEKALNWPNYRTNVGTCLFDATMKALELVAVNAPNGRRAVITFTDGVDEREANGPPCSTSTIDDVIDLATDIRTSIPVYTIGFRPANAPFAEAELQRIANATHASFAIGEDLPSLFQEVKNAIEAQQVAEALVRPRAGHISGQLRIELKTGDRVSESFEFTSPRDFTPSTPTPTSTASATPTLTSTPPPPVEFLVSQPRFNAAKREFIVSVTHIIGDEQIKEFSFDLLTSGGNSLGPFTLPKPLPVDIPIQIPDVSGQRFVIRVMAILNDTRLLPVIREVPAEYPGPTATVTPPPTNTPLPVGAEIDTLRYEDPSKKDVIILKMKYDGREKISTLRITVVNSETNDTPADREPIQPEPEIRFSLKDIPAGKYTINIFPKGPMGEQVGPVAPFSFTHIPPPPTPIPSLTPTERPTPTPTPTPIPRPKPTDFWSRLTEIWQDPNQRPSLILVFGVLAGGLLLMFFLLVRPRKQPVIGGDVLNPVTEAIDVSKLKDSSKKQSGQMAPARKSGQAAPVGDDPTSGVPILRIPGASVYVEASLDEEIAGKTVKITGAPFTLGRRNRDLNFDGDENVSRVHADILYENGAFFIRDNNSRHGTFVEEQPVPSGTRKPLHNQAMIRLGTTTVLRFHVQAKGNSDIGGDPDSTNPEIRPKRK